MTYNLFIFYSRRDNTKGQVLALKEQIEHSATILTGNVRDRNLYQLLISLLPASNPN